MRVRLFVVSSLAVAAVFGAANAAQAHPQGPGDIKYQPQPTTTTTQPKGPDKIAPKPTTTTTTPPKPQGPGDIANPQSDPVVDPSDPGTPGVTGNGSGSDTYYGNPADTDGDTKTTTAPVVDQTPHIADNSAATPATTNEASNLPILLAVIVAGLVGALLALFATRLRRHGDGHAEQV